MSSMLHSNLAHIGLILGAVFLVLVYIVFRIAIR